MPTSDRSVLVVDDDPTFVHHIERFLTQSGSLRVVGTAEDAVRAVSHACDLLPDIILLDVSMPGIDGFEAIAPLQEAAPRAAVIVVTMHEADEYRDRALALGADGFVLKSRIVDDLIPEINRLRPTPSRRTAPTTSSDMMDLTLEPVVEPVFPERVSTGVPGLDSILRGGVPREEIYLVQGGPGTGKTTFGLQFLRTGADVGQAGLYVTLSQSRRSLNAIVRSHGWTLGGVEIREYGDASEASQSVFPSAEVELEETTELIREAVRDIRPQRVVIDTISDLRDLSGDPTRYRRELRQLRQFLTSQGCTVLFLDDTPKATGDRELQNQANGVFALRQKAPDYGSVRRSMQVVKMRSTPFLSGCHNFRIQTGGMVV